MRVDADHLDALRHRDEMYADGRWQRPSTDARIQVTDCFTEEPFFSVPAAGPEDMSRAVAAARAAFDDGPWPRMSHEERGTHLRAMAAAIRARSSEVTQIWPRESGVVVSIAQYYAEGVAKEFEFYADQAASYPFETEMPSAVGPYGLLIREPVGVVGAIVPWNAPLGLMSHKVAPALLAGCTVVAKFSPEAPAMAYLAAMAADEAGLPPGVLNFIVAHRDVSELLVVDERVDKIAFTGSTAAGRRIASLCGDRLARCTLELGGKSAALILDDADISTAGPSLMVGQCAVSGQACAALSRVVVTRDRADAMVDALVASAESIRMGDPLDLSTELGPLATAVQRDRVEGYIKLGLEEGARLAYGGGRPVDQPTGWFVEPTVFADVDNASRLAREEIFGPVLCVVVAEDEDDMVRIANDSPYGLNGAVVTSDPDRAYAIARRLRTGTVGQNGMRVDFGIAFGGFKSSGLGREGGLEGLRPYLETKTVVLDDRPVAGAKPRP